MTPEQAATLAFHHYREGLEAIRALVAGAVEDERRRLLTQEQEVFIAQARVPGTWQNQMIEVAKAGERAACTMLAREEAMRLEREGFPEESHVAGEIARKIGERGAT